jgi:hypothetical protein
MVPRSAVIPSTIDPFYHPANETAYKQIGTAENACERISLSLMSSQFKSRAATLLSGLHDIHKTDAMVVIISVFNFYVACQAFDALRCMTSPSAARPVRNATNAIPTLSTRICPSVPLTQNL